jgi:hypothetical protein
VWHQSEHKIRSKLFRLIKAQIVKRATLEPGAVDTFVELFGHDHVGVDIGQS